MTPEEFYVTGGTALIESPETAGETLRPGLSDESFWHESAPSAVRENYAAGDEVAAWKAWKRHLLRRHRFRALSRLWQGKTNMLAWGHTAPPDSERLIWLWPLLDRRRSKAKASRESVAVNVQQWAEEHIAGELLATSGLPHSVERNGDAHCSSGGGLEHALRPTAAEALESLAWLHLLVVRAELFRGDLWWQVWQQVAELARRPAISLDDDPLGHQLLAGELSLTLAYLFPELNPCRALQAPAAAAISHGMAELLDGEGLPQCRHLAAFPALVACWTRCRLLSKHLGGECWAAEAEQQFPLALREAIRLSRPDGTPAFAAVNSCSASAAAAAAASSENAASEKARFFRHPHRSQAWFAQIPSDLIADKPTRRLIRYVFGGLSKKAAAGIKPRQLPDPAVQSEWAEIGVLQSDWLPRGKRLTVAYGGRAVRLELSVGAELLLAGHWDVELRADGALAEAAGDWREVCWVSDDDCDYLELEMELTGALRIQRQMLLARDDQFLFLADAVLGDRPCELSYCSRLPLAGRLTASAATETRELLLEGRKARALVLPLALPEWRADPRGGSLGIEGGAIELRQTWHGRTLFAPLWIDLSRRRADRVFTWRQLTIAEQRQNQPRDVAVGYRVQFGRRQWLVYRSLAEPSNRTLLGQNLSTDFFLGRFDRDGETEPILEIE